MKRFLIAVSVLVLIFSLALVPAEAKTLAAIIKADKIVFPGVGAFKAAIDKLNDLDLVNTIKDAINSGKPFSV